MTREEVIKILGIIKVAYPNFTNNLTGKDSYNTLIDLWQMQFADYSYRDVSLALNSFISTDIKGFAPTIGMLKEMIYKINAPDEMSEAEAINLIKKACSNSGYHAQEEFDKLPPILQRLVGGPSNLHEWAMMNVDEFNTVVASNLSRSYKAIAKNQKEVAMLPNTIKQLMNNNAALENKKSNGFISVSNLLD